MELLALRHYLPLVIRAQLQGYHAILRTRDNHPVVEIALNAASVKVDGEHHALFQNIAVAGTLSLGQERVGF